jgi:hypothetical protein
MDVRVGWETALAALLLALALSIAIAWVYAATYQGVGYVRGFTQTLSLAGVVSALVMLAIGDDIARGLGLVGALTVIRFRATLKDTRDLMFVFASLTVGVACGVQAFTVALLGSAVFLLAALYLWWSPFGSRRQFDGLIRFRIGAEGENQSEVTVILHRYCREISLVNMREAGNECRECCYHVKLARTGTEATLMSALGKVEGLSGVALLKQDTSLEM